MKKYLDLVRFVMGWMIVGLLMLFSQLVCRASTAPDLQIVADAAKRTMVAAGKSGVLWTSTIELSGGNHLEMKAIRFGTSARYEISAHVGTQVVPMATIIQADGIWYVQEGTSYQKCRPYSAIFKFGTTYIALCRGEYTLFQGQSLGEFETTDGNIATYRVPLSPSQHSSLQGMVSQFETAERANPGLLNSEQLQEQLTLIKDLLAKGFRTKLDVTNGLIVDNGAAKFRTQVTDFRILGNIPPETFETAGKPWRDEADDVTLWSKDDIAMIGYAGFWQPGRPSPDTDTVLVDMKRGAIRRVPFIGASTMTGCFAADRNSVFVSGLNMDVGSEQLFRIDLKTGANQQLGGSALATGFSLFPTLSRDGGQLALLHKGTDAVLTAQVYVINLRTGVARAVGESMDFGWLSWASNDTLVFVRRQPMDVTKPIKDANAVQNAMVCQMDMNGRVTELHPGSAVVVIDEKSMLVQQDHIWKTCNLDGTGEKIVGNGLPNCHFPAPSRDGRHLLMMQFIPGKGPAPVLVDLKDGSTTEIPVPAGFFAMPDWR